MGKATGVIGIGYEGQDLETFVDGLVNWNVRTLVDVRLNAISRKRGFSKTALRAGLAVAGINYRHEAVLGNPKDNRQGFAEFGSAEGREARERFLARLASDQSSAALDSIADLASTSRVAIMCFEQSERHCHRHEVLAELRDRLETLVNA
ncbi:MAG: DUF488 domain-containing protein [Cryobacterium sp.]|uniref:DUF488 domain-containing protein n=1 Tax=Cryobacterium sp. TaxID=1926290 RepID=UPI0022893F67|nr:DUF488 domain-containing protein [Cryobacterium sp.]MCY7403986.1 DUF488 domain-containing protein [Cryobacterium sp.]